MSSGFYSRYILPLLIDLAMGNKEIARLRASWIPRARGGVLEVGIGSGLHLPFYSNQVEYVYGVDPSLELQRMARKRAPAHLNVTFLPQSAEEPLPLLGASIDTIVMTWSMCSIPNPMKALQQMKQVLKPRGRLLFIEHGLSTEPRVVAWQNRLTPLWKRISGGCHLNRKADDLIGEAGFQIIELETFYLPGPRLMTFMYRGIATPHLPARFDAGHTEPLAAMRKDAKA